MIRDRCSYELCKVLLPFSSTGVVRLDFEGSITICSCFLFRKLSCFLGMGRETAAEYVCGYMQADC